MSVTVIENIVDNIVTTLAAIDPENGFNKKPLQVRRTKLGTPNITVFPTYEVELARSSPTASPTTGYGAIDLYEANATVSIMGWFRSSDPTNDAAEMESDVIKALEDDPTRGGYALDSRWDGTDLYLVPDKSGGRVVVQITYRIRYQFQARSPGSS